MLRRPRRRRDGRPATSAGGSAVAGNQRHRPDLRLSLRRRTPSNTAITIATIGLPVEAGQPVTPQPPVMVPARGWAPAPGSPVAPPAPLAPMPLPGAPEPPV